LGLGHPVIPLNTRLTWSEISTILDDAQCQWIVSNRQQAKTFQSAVSAQAISIVLHGHNTEETKKTIPADCFQTVLYYNATENNAIPDGQPVEFPRKVHSQSVATLIYTSGTTGKPKGVMLSHHNILSDAWGNLNVIEAKPDDVLITISPLFHVFGQTNVLLTAIMAGTSLVVLQAGTPTQILKAIERHRVTFMAAVPTMYRMLLGSLKTNPYDTRSLRVCHSGAAPMGAALFHEVESAFGAPVQEGYGLSEASSIVTSNPLHGIRKPDSIGLAIPGVEVLLVNDTGKPVGPLEIGEVCVRGNTVMLGYWKQPELTRNTFLPDNWLKTGDMGYQDDNGYIFLLDRRDDLINVGGVKVYPREIEDVLYQHPAVLETVVVGQPSEQYNHIVTAFVVLKEGQSVTSRELKRHCRKALAPYKVPQRVRLLDALPKGPTGKLLRKALRHNIDA